MIYFTSVKERRIDNMLEEVLNTITGLDKLCTIYIMIAIVACSAIELSNYLKQKLDNLLKG